MNQAFLAVVAFIGAVVAMAAAHMVLPETLQGKSLEIGLGWTSLYPVARLTWLPPERAKRHWAALPVVVLVGTSLSYVSDHLLDDQRNLVLGVTVMAFATLAGIVATWQAWKRSRGGL